MAIVSTQFCFDVTPEHSPQHYPKGDVDNNYFVCDIPDFLSPTNINALGDPFRLCCQFSNVLLSLTFRGAFASAFLSPHERVELNKRQTKPFRQVFGNSAFAYATTTSYVNTLRLVHKFVDHKLDRVYNQIS